jgi:hypothetical protein
MLTPLLKPWNPRNESIDCEIKLIRQMTFVEVQSDRTDGTRNHGDDNDLFTIIIGETLKHNQSDLRGSSEIGKSTPPCNKELTASSFIFTCHINVN